MLGKKCFTVWLKIDYLDDPEGDKLLEKGEKYVGGSYWQWSVGDVLDAENRVLNKQSVIQIDVPCKDGGLKLLLKDIVNRLPRWLDEIGLKSN